MECNYSGNYMDPIIILGTPIFSLIVLGRYIDLYSHTKEELFVTGPNSSLYLNSGFVPTDIISSA